MRPHFRRGKTEPGCRRSVAIDAPQLRVQPEELRRHPKAGHVHRPGAAGSVKLDAKPVAEIAKFGD
ncbi:MAG: hypothetical protein WCP55_23480, partial [Lentisphaerota bacterium]